MKTIGRPPQGLSVRFWRMVDKNGPVPPHCPELGPCWLWIGTRQPDSYGRMLGLHRNHRISAHRVAFFLQHGRWPVPCALHRCDNMACVRWEHIYEGTQAENIQDMIRKGRRPPSRSKLVANDIIEIRRLRSTNVSQTDIAKIFDVDKSTISHICLRKSWKLLAIALISIQCFSQSLTSSSLPNLKTRPVTIILPDPFVGENNLVHNQPSVRRNWIRRHPHIFGAMVIGAGVGIGAGIALSQRRGICQGVYEGQSYYGTSPCPAGTLNQH